MNEKKSLLENVMNFFRFVPKKKTVDKSKDDEADDVQYEKTESYSNDKIQRHKSILNLSKELEP
ncbi:TPA: conjugal transfer protein TraE, partial [Klebsiella pneumoniae]|nr:conjugal transfer protein TraE [Klebsiella pneumoniae]